jgi:hypothetical protein
MFLYHGTSLKSATEICKIGFLSSKIGTGWGTTYGKGFYFTPSIKTAKSYSNGAIIQVTINNMVPYKLKRYYKPKCRKDKRHIQNIINILNTSKKYNSLLTHDGDEYIIFSNTYIKDIKDILVFST